MKSSIIILSIIMLLLSVACLDQALIDNEMEPPLLPIKNEPLKKGAVDFRNLEAGQKSTYLRGNLSCENGELRVRYFGDTLTLEVIEVNYDMLGAEVQPEDIEPSFFFREKGWGPEIGGDFEEIYPVSVINDVLIIPERENSALFFFYDSDRIQLLPAYEAANHVEQDACNLLFRDNQELFEGEAIVSVDLFRVDGFVDQQENQPMRTTSFQWEQKVAVACRPVNLAGNGYLLYDNHQLHLSYNYFVTEFGGVVSTSGIGFFLADPISF